MNYMNDDPERMAEIARLPLSEQNAALRQAAAGMLHHHRELSNRSGASDLEPPAGDAVLSQRTPAGTTSSFDDDGHCDVCGAPVGKHHLSYCDLRGDV